MCPLLLQIYDVCSIFMGSLSLSLAPLIPSGQTSVNPVLYFFAPLSLQLLSVCSTDTGEMCAVEKSLNLLEAKHMGGMIITSVQVKLI